MAPKMPTQESLVHKITTKVRPVAYSIIGICSPLFVSIHFHPHSDSVAKVVLISTEFVCGFVGELEKRLHSDALRCAGSDI